MSVSRSRDYRQHVEPELFRKSIPKVLDQLSSWPHGWGNYRPVDEDAALEGIHPPTWLQVLMLLADSSEMYLSLDSMCLCASALSGTTPLHCVTHSSCMQATICSW